MADIFVSYAKADRALASKMVAMLKAEGWKVWWDTSLAIGDDFRNEIMTELGRARAVLVIWTDASIKSDWVRSEAGRAQADRKLIPVKLEHLAYKDLPPPFDVLHTENVGEEDKIRAAVVAQLAKPAVQPSGLALLTKGFKYELLTWVGIVGGALTLFGNVDTVLKLADWARLLVQNWKEWTHAFWLWAFGWLGIPLPPELTPVLSFLLFGSLLTIGQALQSKRTVKNQLIEDKYKGKAFELRTALRVFGYTLASTIFLYSVTGIGLVVYQLKTGETPGRLPGVWASFGFLILFVLPLVILVIGFARNRLNAGVSICLVILFWIIITFNQIPSPPDADALVGTIAVIWVLPLILLSVAPAKAVSRRLIFLAIGLILLIALNELSKLGFDLTAPKLQG